MVRISSLPDLSRFVRRTGKVKIYNTVHLVVGEEIVEVSGCVISQKSEILQDLAGKQCELFLDQFTGESDGIQDCVELLYGGEVELNETNVMTIFKFSVMYEVQDMYTLSLDWIKDHISTINLFNFIQFGILIERIGQDNHDILDICIGFIKDNVKNDLSEISQSWSIANNINFIKFLAQKEILYFTLPVLTSCVSSDANINMILTELESKGIDEALYEYGERSSDLLDKMSENVQLFDTCNKLLKVQKRHSRSNIESVRKSVERSKSISNKDFASLLSEDYFSFTIDKLFGLEEEYSLDHFQFVEMVLVWIMSNNPSQDDANRLWCNVRQGELCFDYLYYIRDTILTSHSVSIPKVKWLGNDQYKYLSDYMELNKSSQLTSLKINKKCRKCDTEYNIKVKLVNKSPCYDLEVVDSHCVVEHVYITAASGTRCYFSLLADSYSSVKDKIKQCLRSNTRILLVLMYKCDRK